MTNAHDVAVELRNLADSLDSSPEQPMYIPSLFLSHKYQGSEAKETFLAVSKLLPRPLAKGDGYSHDEFTLEYKSDAIRIFASIEKSKTCTLVTPARPAVYDCIHIFSEDDDKTFYPTAEHFAPNSEVV